MRDFRVALLSDVRLFVRLADVRLYSSTLDLNVIKRDTLANLINKYFKNCNEMVKMN